MLSDEMKFDPTREAPQRPMAFRTFFMKYRKDKTSEEYRCPACDGWGEHKEDFDQEAEHMVKCLECEGTGILAFTYIRDYFFRLQQNYLKEYREWTQYCAMVAKIKKKLDKREKVFMGLTENIRNVKRKK